MSVLVEIAEKADVSVEGVVRVLTREPVSDAIKERVLAVLDDLDPEQTRAVQRFALAALHDVLPRPLEPLPELAAESDSTTQLPAVQSDAVLVQLSSVLTELAEAVRDLRRETDAERRERVDDLAVLIDLITTGWQGLDGRLGRLERQLGRLEPGRRPVAETRAIGGEPARSEAPRTEPAPVAATPAATPVNAEPVDAAPVSAEPVPAVVPSSERDRLPLAAALTMGVVVIGTLAVMQLFSRSPDFTGIVSARETPTATGAATTGATTSPSAPARTTTKTATTTRPSPPAPRPGATTSAVLGTAASETKPATTAAKVAPPPAVATTAASPATTGAAGFRPTRNWAWAPAEGADYYAVDFLRAGQSFYRATPSKAALTLPDSIVFRPGSYRWIVRPGSGERSAKKLGEPIVDSPFTVAG